MTIGCRLCLLRVFQVLHTHGSTPGAFALCRSSIRNPSTPVTSDQSQPHHTAVGPSCFSCPSCPSFPAARVALRVATCDSAAPPATRACLAPRTTPYRVACELLVLARQPPRRPSRRHRQQHAAARSSTIVPSSRSVAASRAPDCRARRQATGGATSRAHSIGRHARVDETPLEPEPAYNGRHKKRERGIYPFIPS